LYLLSETEVTTKVTDAVTKTKNENLSKRDPAMDIIRCVACFGVLSVHFFLRNGYYGTPITNIRMCIMTVMRSFFMYCVPLFILLTGYLQCHKKPELSFYKKIDKTLYTYAVSVLFGIYAFPKLYEVVRSLFGVPAMAFEKSSLLDTIAKIIGFEGFYSWYIEMYVGLFLMIPFLNILYNNIKTQKGKQLLILTALLLTAFPAVVNAYCLNDLKWFADPAATVDPSTGSSYKIYKILPEFWFKSYPMTYYFIGCYLREYGLKIKTSLNAILIVLTGLLVGIYNIWRSYGHTFQVGKWTDWYSFFNTLTSVLIFTFFMNLKYDRMPVFLKRIFMKISELTLGIYLFSWSVDWLLYPILVMKVPDVHKRLIYYFIIVPAVFVCSAFISFLANELWKLIQFIKKKINNRFDKNKIQNSGKEVSL